ncbi:MAG: LemA family protein [Actinomycetota bacterium]
MNAVWVVAGLAGFLLLSLAISFNRFVTQRNLIRDSWANIDTELRRRYDLIPNLVETVKGYAAHERQIMEAVSEARVAAVGQTGSPQQQAATENALIGALRQLFAVVENYPDLKASGNFLALQKELATTEDRIQTARRFYNANVRDLNRRCAAIPSSVVAGLFGFKPVEFFEVEPAVRAAGPPTADFGSSRQE